MPLCRQPCQYKHCTSFHSRVICKKPNMFSVCAQLFLRNTALCPIGPSYFIPYPHSYTLYAQKSLQILPLHSPLLSLYHFDCHSICSERTLFRHLTSKTARLFRSCTLLCQASTPDFTGGACIRPHETLSIYKYTLSSSLQKQCMPLFFSLLHIFASFHINEAATEIF